VISDEADNLAHHRTTKAPVHCGKIPLLNSRIVFITHKLERADIEASLELLTFLPQSLELSPAKISAESFAKFSGAMRRMYRIDAS
jgi:hypothetical protein